jgi:hypothetical protein
LRDLNGTVEGEELDGCTGLSIMHIDKISLIECN